MLKQLPTVERLREAVLAELVDRELTPGDRVPSEGKLAEQFGVSRNTVREAMIQLESEGVVARCHGVGTILRRKPGAHLKSGSLPDVIRSQGQTPGVAHISMSQDILDADICARFRIAEDDRLMRLERVLTADERPVAFLVDYLPQDRVREWDIDWSGFDGNLIRVLSDHTGSQRFLQNASLSAVVADEDMAKKLKCEVGTALVKTSSDMFSDKVELLAVTRLLIVPGTIPIDFAATLYATRTL
ncbi:GntR family transcriptional regulator [uncultured Roseobacter sp.]|uniref:GntR family transcriptional regulator n=1 Tax=uncultured Roseobacter sp. TaxID=114847 RepID=UPI002618881E|nr:GntR family transcriptional regulator [uncultured Roseobacter sp.]